MKLTHQMYLAIAIPFILSTLTQPLLGVFNTALIGQLGEITYIAGVSLGAVIFNTIYWMFGFLRVSTTAFSAQAAGLEGDRQQAKTEALIQPGFIAVCIGLLFILFQRPIFTLAMFWLGPESDVKQVTFTYYRILIWGAPLVLLNYVILGWLMGQARIKQSLIQQMGGNFINILLSSFFVLILKMGVAGIAIATLLSQLITFLMGAFFVFYSGKLDYSNWRQLIHLKAFKQMMRVNRDLMIRTFCLLVQANVFMAGSTALGTATLSVNSILLQIQYLMSYTFDGLANASSVYGGKALGSKDMNLLNQVWKKTLIWTLVFIGCWTLVYAWLGQAFIQLFTDIPEVIGLANEYGFWLVLFPLISGIGLSVYGIFTGITYASAVRDSTIMSLLVFLSITYGLTSLGNHGLWIALLGFYGARSVFLIPYYAKIKDNW